jgi:hypothetical protein
MPDDQNQNNAYNPTPLDPQSPQNPQDFQNQGFSTEPFSTDGANQQAAPYNPNDQFAQFDTGAAPQSYGSDFGQPNSAGTGSEAAYSNETGFQSFDTQPTGVTTVPPLDQQYPNTAPAANTFEQKKSGSKVFLYGSIAVVVILLIAMGVLSYFNFFAPGANDNTADQTAAVVNNDDNNEDTDVVTDEPEEEVIVDEGSTGGTTTPASQARENSDSEIPKEWLIQNFVRPEVDIDGNCLNLVVCGNQADPDDDGATNLTEYNFGTDPLEADTDGDLIADGDELFVYFTNPKSARSDTDNFDDGAEIVGCYDPISTVASKMSTQRRTQIASNVTLRPLHEPTKSLLLDAGATQSDIINRAVPLTACPAETGNSTTTPTTADPSTTTNN